MGKTEELLTLLINASQFVRKVTFTSKLGVSSVSWRVVLLLDKHQQLRPSEISNLEQTSRATTSAVLKRLEAEKLIERVLDPQDGRAYFVRLTDNGKTELTQWRIRIRKVLSELENLLDRQQLETLISAGEIMNQLTNKLEKNNV